MATIVVDTEPFCNALACLLAAEKMALRSLGGPARQAETVRLYRNGVSMKHDGICGRRVTGFTLKLGVENVGSQPI